MSDRSEEIRLRYLYRKMILEGKAKVSFEAARALVGPDCAFHLYGRMNGKQAPRKIKRPAG